MSRRRNKIKAARRGFHKLNRHDARRFREGFGTHRSIRIYVGHDPAEGTPPCDPPTGYTTT